MEEDNEVYDEKLDLTDLDLSLVKLFDEKRGLLRKTASYIMKKPNTKEKMVLVQAYFSLLEYYQEILFDGTEIATPEEYQDRFGDVLIDEEFLRRYYKLVYADTRKDCEAIEKNALPLYRKFSNIINAFKEEGYKSHLENQVKKVGHEKMLQLIDDFFLCLGEDVHDLYVKMTDSGNTFAGFTPCNFTGFAHDTFPIDNPNIIVRNTPYNFDYYLTIVHEMGHAYQFYLQRNQKSFSMLSLYVEVTSHLFEKLFLDYLNTVNETKYCLQYIEEDYSYYLNSISSSKVLCKLLQNKNIKEINGYTLDYDCYVSPEKRNEDMEKDCGYIIIKKDIYKKMKYDDVVCKDKKEFLELERKIREEKELFDSLPKNQSCVEFRDLKYAIGRSLAICFHEKLKNNFEEEWKNYKNFICTVNYLPLNEVVEDYLDDKVITGTFKRFIKSYRER